MDVLQLGPLTDPELAWLVVAEGDTVTPCALHRIVDPAQGNPLYAEQLLAAADDGDIDAIPASLVRCDRVLCQRASDVVAVVDGVDGHARCDDVVDAVEHARAEGDVGGRQRGVELAPAAGVVAEVADRLA